MFNITVEEAQGLFEFSNQETLADYMELFEARRAASGQLYLLNETDVGDINRICGIKPEKLNYFNLSID